MSVQFTQTTFGLYKKVSCVYGNRTMHMSEYICTSYIYYHVVAHLFYPLSANHNCSRQHFDFVFFFFTDN